MTLQELSNAILEHSYPTFKQSVLLQSDFLHSYLDKNYTALRNSGSLYRLHNLLIVMSYLMEYQIGGFESSNICRVFLLGKSSWAAFENQYIDYFILLQDTFI